MKIINFDFMLTLSAQGGNDCRTSMSYDWLWICKHALPAGMRASVCEMTDSCHSLFMDSERVMGSVWRLCGGASDVTVNIFIISLPSAFPMDCAYVLFSGFLKYLSNVFLLYYFLFNFSSSLSHFVVFVIFSSFSLFWSI